MHRHDDYSDSRSEAIAHIVEQLWRSRAAGELNDDESVVRTYPELMPELATALKKLKEEMRACDLLADSLVSPPDVPHLLPKISGYEVLDLLGSGKQSRVYLGSKCDTGQNVAIKVILSDMRADHDALLRFQREVDVLAQLNHPNIVTIVGSGRLDDGRRFISMRLVGGQSLTQYMMGVYATNSPDIRPLLEKFCKVCDAVHAAHQEGIIHRDLKPQNIQIDDRGDPVLLDFGMVHLRPDVWLGRSGPMTMTGAFVGSPAWASPEQARGTKSGLDVHSDIYSLGVILYQIFTGGKFPYKVEGTLYEALHNIQHANPAPLLKAMAPDATTDSSLFRRVMSTRRRQATSDPEAQDIVSKALQKSSADRFQTAALLGEEVRAYLARVESNRWLRRRRWDLRTTRWLAFGLAGLGLLAVVIFFTVRGRATPPPLSVSATSLSPSRAISNDPMSEPAPASGRRVDMIPLINLTRDVERGAWQVGHELKMSSPRPSRLRLPYRPPAEYDFLIEFTVAVNPPEFDGIRQLCTGNNRPFAWEMGSQRQKACGLVHLLGRTATATDNVTAFARPGFPAIGQRYRSMVKVRRKSVSVWVDDEKVVDYPTDFHELDVLDQSGVGADVLGLWGCHVVTFHRVEVLEITGSGKVCSQLPMQAIDLPPDLPRLSLIGIKPKTGPKMDGGRVYYVGREVIVDGKPCNAFLHAAAPASYIYDVPQGVVAFHAIGVKPTGKYEPFAGTWKYLVYVDGDLAFSSQTIHEAGGKIDIMVGIPPGAKTIELRTSNPGGNIGCLAVWAYPEFILPKRTDPSL